jgi:hypothetical protein
MMQQAMPMAQHRGARRTSNFCNDYQANNDYDDNMIMNEDYDECEK